MIMSVDDDGEIQFEEFLEIVKGGGSSSDTVKITQFFKDLISGKLQGSEGETDLSFNMIVGNFRREHMMNAVLKHDTKNLDQGKKILQNVALSQELARQRDKDEEDEDNLF